MDSFASIVGGIYANLKPGARYSIMVLNVDGRDPII